MTDPNAPQNVPSEQPTPVPPSQPPVVPDAQQPQPRYGELQPDAAQQPWNQQPGQPGQYGQPPQAPAHQPQQTGQYGQPSGQYGQPSGQYDPSQTGQYGQPAGQYGQFDPSQTGQYGQQPYLQQPYAQQAGPATPKAPNPRARETRLALVSVGIAAGIAVVVALVSLIGSFFSISEYLPVGDLLLGFGANLVNIALWGAAAALILIAVRPLTRVRTARDLLQAIGLAAAVGTGVMLVVVLLVTIVRGVVEQYGSAAFFVNQGFLSPILYGVTLAGFLTIGALFATRFVAPEGLADAPHESQSFQQGQPFQQSQPFQQEQGQHQQQGQPFQQGQHQQQGQPFQQGQQQQHNPYQQ